MREHLTEGDLPLGVGVKTCDVVRDTVIAPNQTTLDQHPDPSGLVDEYSSQIV